MPFIKTCALILLTTVALSSQAASVWKISLGENITYIGGTIHILSPDDYPLPTEYDVAYAAADTLIFETDMVTLNTPTFQQKMLAQMAYSDGTTLKTVLRSNTYETLKAHLAQRNVSIETMAHFKPSFVAVTLSILELKALGFTSEGVDQYYANRALADSKNQGWFETPEEQIAFLVNLGQEDESSMIDYAIRDTKNLSESINELRSSWREGDMQTMADLSIKEFKRDYPQIYQDLLVERNNAWLPKIEELIRDKPVEFILVGTMHLAGPDSVLAKLIAKGYKVEKL